jgi:hypothetical protein
MKISLSKQHQTKLTTLLNRMIHNIINAEVIFYDILNYLIFSFLITLLIK